MRIEEAIARLVAEAPPLSKQQRVRLAEIFAEARRDHRPQR
ncbi:hypothetical protein [Catelliglobosispora koreensis]|nr:hypothetical protein [Catelliglobosispora koreensis]